LPQNVGLPKFVWRPDSTQTAGKACSAFPKSLSGY